MAAMIWDHGNEFVHPVFGYGRPEIGFVSWLASGILSRGFMGTLPAARLIGAGRLG
jgi:hypothetical protein